MTHIPKIPAKDHREPDGDWAGDDAAPGTSPDNAPGDDPRTEPLFTVPGVVAALLATLAGIHLIRSGLSPYADRVLLDWFAFVPARYMESSGLPGGPSAVWSLLTSSLIHASWPHLLNNGLWLVVFGSAVARRFGPVRFLALFCAAAVGGSLLHLFAHPGSYAPVVGASDGIAGLMAAAARFVFDDKGPLIRRGGSDDAYRRPARSLRATLANRTALTFIAFFFLINLFIGVAGEAMGAGVRVAWQAHIGGFLVGLLLFRLFDPVRR